MTKEINRFLAWTIKSPYADAYGAARDRGVLLKVRGCRARRGRCSGGRFGPRPVSRTAGRGPDGSQARTPARLRHASAQVRQMPAQRFITGSLFIVMHASAHMSATRAHVVAISTAWGD